MAFHLAKVDDEFGGKGELTGISNDEADAVLEDEMHLALAGMGDVDLDEHRVGKQPGFGWFGLWHP